MSKCGMRMKFANVQYTGFTYPKDIKDCLVHVETSMKGSGPTSILHIFRYFRDLWQSS